MKSKIRDPCLALAAEADAIEQLALERGEEALTHCLVVAVAHRSHRRLDAGLATPQPERDRRILAALEALLFVKCFGAERIARVRDSA